MATQALLSNIAPILLPPTITGPVFDKAREQSAVMALSTEVPLSWDAQTAIPVFTDIPKAGFVAEGGMKPVGTAGAGVKLMQGKKLALLLPISQEVARSNPAGLYDRLQNVLPTAMARSFDYAAIHGLDYATGGASPFQGYLAQTSNTQVIGATAASSGGVFADLVKGEQQVVNGPMPYDFNGFAADPRLKPELKLSVDTQGRPLFVDAYPSANQGPGGIGNAQAVAGSLIGYPVAYNPGVSGHYRYTGNAVQTITINGTPTGGTFTVTVEGYTTAGIAYNATGATVQTAIQALGPGTPYGGLFSSSATVSGSAGGPYTVTFSGNGSAAPVTVNQTGLTGGTASTSQATVAQSPVTDTGLRAIGGDFSQCAYGIGSGISVQVSNQASYSPDGGTTWVSAFQNNLLLLLVEMFVGFIVNDTSAFVAYTHSAGS